MIIKKNEIKRRGVAGRGFGGRGHKERRLCFKIAFTAVLNTYTCMCKANVCQIHIVN